MGLHPRQLLNTWWIDRASVLDSVKLFLNTSSIPQLSTIIFSTPPSTGVSIPLDTCICRDLLLALFKLLVRLGFHFIRSLSRYFSVFSPKTFSSHSKLFSSRILQAFSRISSLGKLLILSHSCISCFETQVLGFLKNFGVFQN